jgi:hypothetical protein
MGFDTLVDPPEGVDPTIVPCPMCGAFIGFACGRMHVDRYHAERIANVARPLTAEEIERARQATLRILRKLAAQRPGPDGDEVRAEIARVERWTP